MSDPAEIKLAQSDSVNAASTDDMSVGKGIGRAVCLDKSGGTVFQRVSNSPILGVMANNPSSGQVGETLTGRGVIYDIISGGPINPGDKLMVDPQGQFITAFGPDVWVTAYALGKAGGQGELFKAILIDAYIP